MSDVYVTTTDAAFKSDVLDSATPVIVDFWATWCPPCRMMAPIFEDLAREYTGKMTFVKMDTDENPMTMMRYGIQGIPTMLIFSNGQVVEELVGARPRQDLKQHIDQALSVVAKKA
jgi:thioredoxin 1